MFFGLTHIEGAIKVESLDLKVPHVPFFMLLAMILIFQLTIIKKAPAAHLWVAGASLYFTAALTIKATSCRVA